MAAIPPDRLTSLPAELLTKVLESLPVRETSRLRIISSEFRDFIDRSEEALARMIADCHSQRISNRLSWLIRIKDVSLLNILHHYSSYYGNMAFVTRFRGREWIIISVVQTTLDSKYPTLSSDDRTIVSSNVIDLWHHFADCHHWMHNRSASEESDQAYVNMKQNWELVEGWAALHALDDPMNNVAYLRAPLQDRNLLQGPRHTSKHGLPQYPITARNRLRGFGSSDVLRRSYSLLRERFRLPSPLVGGLGYCVKMQRGQDMVYITCTSTEPWKTALLQSPFRQAALLEEIFVF
ncbi:hypothetical protein B0A48_08542 [Cryoendolithus antarcticus]|uniref:F-box domain-containing protein n=1 Tax=Cryoendolithus antarcticus TaxID=1507870 RepID=A0A1V8T634_9PEZI|nr:hypothetical protein B0A48_08542 [Cryoendolithus antarcticus]